jgi:hypothetical protein
MKLLAKILFCSCLYLSTAALYAQETKHTWEQIQQKSHGSIYEAPSLGNDCVFPSFKYIAANQWSHNGDERTQAFKILRDSPGEILFELVIDDDGKVVRIRPFRDKHQDRRTVKAFKGWLSRFQFSVSMQTDTPFRTFYLIMDADNTVGIQSSIRQDLD